MLWLVVPVVAGGALAHAEPRDPVVPGGALDVSLSVETDLSLRKRFDVVSAAPDLRWGVTDHLTLGLTHSMAGRSVIDSGGGLCSGCDEPYSNVFFDLSYNIHDRAQLPAAGRLRLGASAIDPLTTVLSLGATGRFGSRRMWIQLDPALQLGLNRTDQGNENQWNLPLWVAVLVSRATVFVQTGIVAPAAALGDEHRIPLGIGTMIEITPRWEVGAEIAFPRLLGPLNSERARHGSVYVRYRLPAT